MKMTLNNAGKEKKTCIYLVSITVIRVILKTLERPFFRIFSFITVFTVK